VADITATSTAQLTVCRTGYGKDLPSRTCASAASASSVQALRQQGSSWYYFNRQLLWLALGSTACFALSRIDYGVLRRLFGARLSSLALFASTFALFLTLVPSIGITIYGSSRWISVGFLTVQPSEFVKLSFIFFLADVIDRRYHVREDVATILKPSLLWLGVLSVIVALQPDLSATITLGAIVLTMWAIANVPWRYLLGLGGVGALLFAASIALNPYQRERFLSFTDPLANSQGGGYQALQSMIAEANALGFRVAIAGSLPLEALRSLASLGADWIGVRGAVCDGPHRTGSICETKVSIALAKLAKPFVDPCGLHVQRSSQKIQSITAGANL
jgi:hypothetical protein